MSFVKTRTVITVTLLGACLHGPVQAIPPQEVLDRLQPPLNLELEPATSDGQGAVAQGTSGGFDVFNMVVRSQVTPQSFSTNASCTVSPTNVCANDIWGYVSPSGREYAILGLRTGTGVVDVSDPDAPIIVGSLPDASSVWSDMRTYQQYMYNCTDASGGLQVISLANVDPPTRQLSLVRTVTQSGLSRSHTLAINEQSAHLYLCGSNLAGGRLVAMSLADPSNPVIVGQMVDATYVHAAQVVTYDSGPYAGREIAFCFCGSQGLKIVDVTNKSNMVTLGHLIYPNTTYCHQGWLTADRRHVLINDELDERDRTDVNTTTTYIVNVEDLTRPSFVSTFTNGQPSIDHNLMIRNYDTPTGLESFVFEANYTSGLRVYDITDLADVSEVGWVDSYPLDNSVAFNGAWGVYALLPSGMILLSDMQAGLLVIDPAQIAPNECLASSAPQAEASPLPRNRYLALTPGNPGVQTAIRLRVVDLPPPFESLEGMALWLDQPEPVVDTINPQTTIQRSRLSCDPLYRDWGAGGTIFVSDHEVMPGGVYEFQHTTAGCNSAVEANYSAALAVATSPRWGDLVGTNNNEPPNNDTNFIDISALVDKFKNAPFAPGLAVADLSPSRTDGIIDFTDISACVDAFSGVAYPFSGPFGCP